MSVDESHPRTEILTLWSLGDMGPEESARVATHIAGCDDCRIEMAEIQTTLGMLRRDVDVPPTDAQLAAARLAARMAFRTSRRRPTWVIWAASAAAAILIAAIGAVGAGLLGSGSPPGGVAEVAEQPAPEPPDRTAFAPSADVDATSDGSRGALPGPSVGRDPADRERVPAGTRLPVSSSDPVSSPAGVRPPPRKGGVAGPLVPDSAPGGLDPATTVQRPNGAAGSTPATTVDGGRSIDSKPNPDGAAVSKGPAPAAPAATAENGGADGAAVDRGDPPTGGVQRTGVLPSPVIALSSLGSLKSAQIEWPDGRLEDLEGGRGLPWDAKIHVEATSANPAVLVLDDGGVVTIQAGKATIHAALSPEPKRVRANPEAPKSAGREFPLRRDRIRISPAGARVVYVSIPYGRDKIRVIEVGGLGLMVRGGTEVLLQFNAEGAPIGIAELSGDKDLLFYIDGREAPVEIERDHSLSLVDPDRPSRPGAVRRAGNDLKKIRLIHARESLQSVLDTARKSWPKAAPVIEHLSRLKAETLRLNSTSLREILETLANRGFSPLDSARVIRSVRLVDRDDRASLGALYYFLKLIQNTPSRGEQLQAELDELTDMAPKKFVKVGVRGR